MHLSTYPRHVVALLFLGLVSLTTACGSDDPNLGENNSLAPGQNNTAQNNTTPNNNGVQDMGNQPNNTTPANNATPANNTTPVNNVSPNNTTPGNNTTPSEDMGMPPDPDMGTPEPPPLADVPWPKFRANSEQSGRVDFPLVDDGSEPWTFLTGGPVISSPVIDASGVVYIGSSDKSFYAISAVGDEAWSFQTDGEIHGSALLDDLGQVIFGSTDGKMYALTTSAGDLNWATEANAPMAPATTNHWEGGVALGADGRIIAGNDGANLYVLDRVDGAVVKRTSIIGKVWGTVAIDIETGDFFIGTNDLFNNSSEVLGFDLASGALWSAPTLGSVVASPLFYDDRLYVGSFDGSLHALDAASGASLWTFPTRDHVYASPALLSSGVLVQAGADGTVYGVDESTGAQTWSFDWGAPIRSSPAIDGQDNIYFGASDGHLVSLDAQGVLRWSMRLIDGERDDLRSSPALAPNAIVIAGESGEVFRIPPDFCLRAAQANNPDCVVGPTTPPPSMGASLLYTSRFGATLDTPPAVIDAHEGLTFSLRARDANGIRLALLDEASTQVVLDPPVAASVTFSGDRQFITILPDARFMGDATNALDVTISGDFLVDPIRDGLATSGGAPGGSFSQSFSFTLSPDRNEASFFPFPEDTTSPAGVFWLHELLTPLPSLLSSYAARDARALDYLVTMIEGTMDQGVGWVVEAAPIGPNDELRPVPGTRGVFPVSLTFDRGRWTMSAAQGARFAALGATLDVSRARVTFSEEIDGALITPGDVTASIVCADISGYSDALRGLGLCNPTDDLLTARGAVLVSPHEQGVALPPARPFGEALFSFGSGRLDVTLTESTLELDADYVGIVLVDATSGRPLPIDDYGERTRQELDAMGHISRVSLEIPAQMLGANVRAYLVVGTYPAASASLTLQ